MTMPKLAHDLEPVDSPSPVTVLIPCDMLTEIERQLVGRERIEQSGPDHTLMLFTNRDRPVILRCDRARTS